MAKKTVKNSATQRVEAAKHVSAEYLPAATHVTAAGLMQEYSSRAHLLKADTLDLLAPESVVDPGEHFECLVPALAAPIRLDAFLAQQTQGLSRSFVQHLIAKNLLTLDGQVCVKPARKVVGGEALRLRIEASAEANAYAPQALPIDVVFEDDHLAVLHKPAGLVVHPGAGNWSGTLLNGLLHRYPASAELPRAGIVHRLDKDTSGLMVVAKSRPAYTALVDQIAQRAVSRQYLAVVHGHWRDGVGIRALRSVELPIGRDQANRLRMAVAVLSPGSTLAHSQRTAAGADPAHAKPAQTDFVCLASSVGVAEVIRPLVDVPGPFSLLQARLHSGRTHQIRVHAAFIGHPLVGDTLYGGSEVNLKDNIGSLDTLGLGGESNTISRQAQRSDAQVFKRQALHAALLAFSHPVTQAPLRFEAPLPDDLRALCATLDLQVPAFVAL